MNEVNYTEVVRSSLSKEAASLIVRNAIAASEGIAPSSDRPMVVLDQGLLLECIQGEIQRLLKHFGLPR